MVMGPGKNSGSQGRFSASPSTIRVMADTLYLSLWYPDLRLASLADKLTAVLGAFAAHGGEQRVYSATVWPVDWSETPVFQQIYGRRLQPVPEGQTPPPLGALPKEAVTEAMEHLHEDYAWEFQIGWSLWEPEQAASQESEAAGLDARWIRQQRLIRVIGYGPLFDSGAYEADGHLRIDFGSDTPFLEEDVELDAHGLHCIQQNIQQLLSLAGAAEKVSGATARLLWSELGENLAERLAARLGVKN